MKVIKKANGKQAVQMTKAEWLKIGQALGMPTGGMGTGGMGDNGLGGMGDQTPPALPAETGSEDPFADDLGGDTGDLGGDAGEEPMAKIRRLVGEIQSALDELDGGGVGDDLGGELGGGDELGGGEELGGELGASPELGANPADQVL